jgi:hypothetical protein
MLQKTHCILSNEAYTSLAIGQHPNCNKAGILS